MQINTVQINEDWHPDIRHATEHDLTEIAVSVNMIGMLADRLRRQSNGLGELWTAVEGDQPIGFVYLWLVPAEEPVVREKLPGIPLIMNLWVRDDRRGHGIGSDLIAAAERRLWALGHARVALGVDPDNVSAIHLYKSLEYAEWEHDPEVQTRRAEFGPNGTVVSYPEVCKIYVKNLASVASVL